MGKAVNAKVGIMGFTVARGFIFDDDASGVMLTGKFGNVTVPVFWINAANEDTAGWNAGMSATMDMNIFGAMAAVKINDSMSVTPYFVYHTISAAEAFPADGKNWYLGADADLKFGSVSVWATAIYNGGQINDVDNKAYLGAVGVDAGIVHGQFFYASGDDGKDATENNAFVSAPGTGPEYRGGAVGQSYYWSEILGNGAFDNDNPWIGDDITNIWAGNVGVTFKPMDKLKIGADVWYASLAEDNKNGDTELGVEFDGLVSYNIYDNLTADLIFAYLLSGDVIGDEDVIEGGLRLSLKF
jgi:hypothetical protein